MDVVVIGGGKVIVDDMGDIVDVEASCRDVGRDQHLYLIVLETFEGALALALRFVAVDGFGFESAAQEFFGKFFDAVLGPAENKHFFEIRIIQNIMKNIHLVEASYFHDVLLHIF